MKCAGHRLWQAEVPEAGMMVSAELGQMKTIEATATISPDGTLTVHVPPEVPPGEHRVVVVIEEQSTEPATHQPVRPPLALPVINVGSWPADLSLRREDMYGDDGR